MSERRTFGVDCTIDGIALRNSAGDFVASLPIVTGDVTVSFDGGAVAPVAIPAGFSEVPAASGNYRLFIGAGSMSVKRMVVSIADQTVPKAWIDTRVIVETQGNPLAQFPDAGLVITPADREAIAADTDTQLTTTHGEGSWQAKTIVGGETSTDEPLPVLADLVTAISRRFHRDFLANGVVTDATPAHWAFTIKRNVDEDSDDAALLAIRKAFPADAGTDGLFMLNGEPVTGSDRALASIAITSNTPNTALTVDVAAAAMNLPIPDDGAAYQWELTYWDSTNQAERFGTGGFTVERPVRRSNALP